MPGIFLLHWNEAEAQERAQRIRNMGYDVRTESSDGARGGNAILANPPAAVVVDLSRLPSHGRETAHYLHYCKAGRSIPIVFLPGDPLKMEKVRQAVPDGIWSSWDRLADDLNRITADSAVTQSGNQDGRRSSIRNRRAKQQVIASDSNSAFQVPKCISQGRQRDKGVSKSGSSRIP
ncbi:MAG TPA: hypothetical protein VGM03_07290 [Phycisphaerae bacterium]